MEDRNVKSIKKACLALMLLAGLAVESSAQTPAVAYTAVVLDDIHCMGCARKIAKHIHTVPGVFEMRVDLKTRMIWAMHKQGMTPSPEALWTAIEAADHLPKKMQTPTAIYTSKPQS